MGVVISMAMAGDLARQINQPGNVGRRVLRLESYTDEQDRARVKVIWAE